MEEGRGVTMHGTHLLCSRTQVGVTLSSEAELDAALTMTCLRLSQFCSEFGHTMKITAVEGIFGGDVVRKRNCASGTGTFWED